MSEPQRWQEMARFDPTLLRWIKSRLLCKEVLIPYSTEEYIEQSKPNYAALATLTGQPCPQVTGFIQHARGIRHGV